MTTLKSPGWVRLVGTPVAVALLLLGLYLYIQSTPSRITEASVLSQTFITSRLLQHLEIVGISFTLAAVVGLPLGVLMANAGRLVSLPVFLVANLGQAVPSIGILALGLTFFGLGIKGPVTALVLYALLPILRNTLVGLQGVDPAAIEAARGMGMTQLQTLARVQLPLASPVIFAGLRVSLVLVVGTATLANFVGGGGLGDLINSGNLYHPRPILVGAVIVSALALLADWALGLVERAVSPRT
ncbi:MAG TPA: ABC transporter permease [Candidatus Dormibacteraeota bacterium]|nr:ABC transporter permease [Candidatus Dormibacteraeota bacterium]